MINGFEEVQLTGKYTVFKLNISDEVDYFLEASGRYSDIDFPSSFNITYERDGSSYHEVEGYMGSTDVTSRLKAKLDYGELSIY